MTRGHVFGIAGLVLCALLGLTSGVRGAVFLGLFYVALCAGWAIVRGRTWWGPMPRPVAAACAGVALALSVGTAATAPTAPVGTPPGAPSHVEPAPTEASPGPEEVPAVGTPDPPGPEPEQLDAGPPETARAGTALAAVSVLDVKGRAPRTGYDRDLFGPAWADADHNGCDQRNDVLRRDLVDVETKPGTQGCVVLTGTFHDPYSGRTVPFQRGQGTSEAVQVDHVVALSDAWQKGAQQWDRGTREAFANDLLNLLAADGPLNQQKGDGDTATWLPPNVSFRCAYVARQVAVKAEYGLWVTPAERDAMVAVLSTCPDEPLPGVEPSVPLADGTSEAGSEPRSEESRPTVVDAPPAGGDPSCPVKGNHSSSGDWIYHVPSGRYYDVTNPEECFATPAEAEAAGYRASKQ